jgi:glucokinase
VITKKLQKGEKVSFCEDEKSVENLTAKDIAKAASKGDETAIEIFELSGHYLGKGLSILIDILNPQRIVIGSVYARNTQLFEKACLEIINQEALKPARDVCEIVPAALGDQIGDYACLSVAMSHQKMKD